MNTPAHRHLLLCRAVLRLWDTLVRRAPPLAVLLFGLIPTLVDANPPAGTVVSGSATFQHSGAHTTIATSHQAILQFDSFSIPAGHTVQFVQPSETSRVLNRVTGGDPSHIYGSLLANGIVYFANPAGIWFGPGAFVDVGALYAAAGARAPTPPPARSPIAIFSRKAIVSPD
jgi:filamentous hemagglutinin family protein